MTGVCGSCGSNKGHIEGRCRNCGGPFAPRDDTAARDAGAITPFQIEEAVSNIRMAIRRLYGAWENEPTDEVNEAIADLEQAVRYLTDQETPS